MLADWMVGGEPREWSLVELGPGRGTLTKDILRVFGQFRRVLDSLSVHLVEASPTMSHLQEKTLTGLNIIISGDNPSIMDYCRGGKGGGGDWVTV